jgi:predicted transglutaminase-like cysteine proteinase
MQPAIKHMALGVLLCLAAQPSDSALGSDNVLPPLAHTYFCLRYPRDCERADSTRALPASMDERWHQLNFVNTSVNTAIAPKPDNPKEINAHWLIAPREGDCADYAVTKRHMLLTAGWPSSSLLLAEVTLISTGEHHLILIVKDADSDWVLDNLKPVIVRLSKTRNQYTWDRVESVENPKFWTKSFAGLS